MVWKALAQYISERGIMQSHLAQVTGMTTQQICNILNGKRKLDVEEYISICGALGVPCDYFIERKPHKNRYHIT